VTGARPRSRRTAVHAALHLEALFVGDEADVLREVEQAHRVLLALPVALRGHPGQLAGGVLRQTLRATAGLRLLRHLFTNVLAPSDPEAEDEDEDDTRTMHGAKT
jgi:hypothetical protein